MPVIRISENLYKRLSKYADGFDTPANVIERLLNEKERIPNSGENSSYLGIDKPKLIFSPNEDDFKKGLINNKSAKVKIYYADGSVVNKNWKSNNFTENSNLRANIWSGYLRGWKDLGIIKAEFNLNDWKN